ncbi:hypothetical protein WJX72_008961 [[Myrmecia] bisecta]|uniref:Kelch repeat-containing protein n=1 Tax=[Myrmecia] bisecta TaxID=41462 RepID=A0AAW1PPG9_9CHLO
MERTLLLQGPPQPLQSLSIPYRMEAAAQPLLGDTTASELPKLTRRRCSAPGTVGAASGLGWGVLKLSIGAIALLAVIAGGCIAAFITIYGTGSIGADRPEPRKSAGMVVIDAAPSQEVTAYLPEREELVVFGGDAMDIGKPGAIKKQHYLNDMWRTHPKSKQPIWEPVTALGNSSSDAASQPLPRRAHSGCLLPERNGSNSLLIYGGRDEHRRLLRDVWAAKLMNTGVIWSQLYFPPRKWHPNAEPGPRKGHVAVMLPGKTRRMLIFGGRNDSAVAYYTDMWAFDVDKQQWEQLGPPRGIAPPARDHFGAFYHHGKVVIYGGRGGADYSSSQPLGDMWEYDVASNSWREVTPEPGPYPLPRFLYSSDSYTVANATSDEVDTRFVVFGGEARHVCYLNDVWEYSQLANRWSQLSPVDWKQAHCSRLKPTEGPSGASQAEARIQELGARLGDFW